MSTGSQAAVIKHLEFNVDGVLPSADPQIELFNNTGQLETTIFSVTGSILQQRTFSVNGNATYAFPNVAVGSGGLDASQNLSLEARLRINAINGVGGAFSQAFDGSNRYTVNFEVGTVRIFHGASQFQEIALDIDQFHTYRIDSGGGSGDFDFYIDNALTFSGTAVGSALNGMNFGDGTTSAGNGANVDWDFVRLSQSEIVSVSAPHAGLFLAGGIAFASFGRRLRRRQRTPAL